MIKIVLTKDRPIPSKHGCFEGAEFDAHVDTHNGTATFTSKAHGKIVAREGEWKLVEDKDVPAEDQKEAIELKGREEGIELDRRKTAGAMQHDLLEHIRRRDVKQPFQLTDNQGESATVELTVYEVKNLTSPTFWERGFVTADVHNQLSAEDMAWLQG